jgi:hypothetical protein
VIALRKSQDRFHTRIDWLDSRHTFSFAEHYDPRHMGFRALRVINEDRIAAGAGFPPHAHRDAEIITYVLAGAIQHQDSLGNGSVIQPGDVQRMSAGTGVRHSEYNPDPEAPAHFLQIWILPDQQGLPPSYEQKTLSSDRRDRLRLIAAPGGRDGAVTLHQDAEIYAGLLAPEATLSHELAPNRHAWLQLARGAVAVNGLELEAGDGAAISAEAKLELTARVASELLLFDLS